MISSLSSLLGRAALVLVASLVLGGCNMGHQMPPPESSPKPRPMRPALSRPKSTSRAAPRPTPRRTAQIVYGIATRRKVLALTFDDGPDPTWTPQVLASLKRHRVPATFFMVGTMVRAHPHFAQMVKRGKFAIGSHTWSHPSAPHSPRAEIERTDAIMQQVLGFKPTLFRPPYGIMNNGLVKTALAHGQNAIMWNSLGADWDKRATAASIADKVIHGARPGGITLLHDGGGHRQNTVAALPRIISTLRGRGYRFVSVPELLAIGAPLHTFVSLTPRPKKPEKRPVRRANPRQRTQHKPVVHSTPTATPRPTLRRAAPTPRP